MKELNKAYVERALGLPQKALSDPKVLNQPETQALLRLLTALPWLLEVCDRGFDPKAVNLIMIREACKIKLQELDR